MQKVKSLNVKNKILIGIVVLILIIVGSLAILKLNKKNDDPSKIVENIVNAPQYQVDISYMTKNSRGEFTKEGKISHTNDETKLVLDDKEQIFSEDKIKINYFEGDKHFTVARDYDEFYRFFLLNELSQYMSLKDTKYSVTENEMIIDFNTNSDNRNFATVKFVVDLKEEKPKELVIFDDTGADRIIVNYNNFVTQVN
ncbi:MAG: hypothetical protein ACRC57_12375 [Sarcina sp.]